MSALFEALLAVLRRQGMPHTVLDDREVAESRFGGGRFGVTMRCMADARADRPMLLCYSTLDARVTWIGSFELVNDTGEVRFRTAVDFGLQHPTAGLVEPAVVLNVAGVNARLPHIWEVIEGDDEKGADYAAYR